MEGVFLCEAHGMRPDSQSGLNETNFSAFPLCHVCLLFSPPESEMQLEIFPTRDAAPARAAPAGEVLAVSRGRVCPEIHLRFAGRVIPLAPGQSATGAWVQHHRRAWAAGSTHCSTAGLGDGLINGHRGDGLINAHRAACPCRCTHFCTAACLQTDGLYPASAPAHASSCNLTGLYSHD